MRSPQCGGSGLTPHVLGGACPWGFCGPRSEVRTALRPVRGSAEPGAEWRRREQRSPGAHGAGLSLKAGPGERAGGTGSPWTRMGTPRAPVLASGARRGLKSWQGHRRGGRGAERDWRPGALERGAGLTPSCVQAHVSRLPPAPRPEAPRAPAPRPRHLLRTGTDTYFKPVFPEGDPVGGWGTCQVCPRVGRGRTQQALRCGSHPRERLQAVVVVRLREEGPFPAEEEVSEPNKAREAVCREDPVMPTYSRRPPSP